MLRFKKTSIVYAFYLIILFFNIITNRISSGLVYLTVGSFLAFLFFDNFARDKKVKFNFKYGLFCLLALVFYSYSHFYQKGTYLYSNLYFLQFFGFQFVMLFVLFSSTSLNNFFKKHYASLLSWYVVIIFASIFIDYLIIKLGFPLSLQPMYRAELESYMDRPFGLFGQPSVNSTLLVFFYLLGLFEGAFSKTTNKFLFVLVTLGVVFQGSGSGFVSYLFLLICLCYQKMILRVTLIPFVSVAIAVVISQNLIQKISWKYISFLMEYFWDIILLSLSKFESVMDLLFGMDGNIDFPIDFGPIFMIAKVGLFAFLIYYSVFFYLFFKIKNSYFRYAIVVLFFGNLHYPVMFYPAMNFFLPLLIFKLLSSEHQLKLNREKSS